MSTWPIKDPSEILNYTFNFSREMESGEAITGFAITVDEGLVLDASSNTTTTVTARVSGGTNGRNGSVRCEVDTDASQKIIDVAYIPIRTK